MNLFIQRLMLLAASTAPKATEAAGQTTEATSFKQWLWLWVLWFKSGLDSVWQYYYGHCTIINLSIIALIGLVVYFRVSNKTIKDSYNESLADILTQWLAPQSDFTAEELKPEFLLLLHGQRSEILSDVITALKCEYTKSENSGQYMRNLSIEYKKDEQALKTILSNNIEWEDVPSEIRREFIMNNPKTVVYNYLEQKFEENKKDNNEQ